MSRLTALLFLVSLSLFASDPNSPKSVDPDEALKRLMAGNARCSTGKWTHQRITRRRISEVAKGQTPFAAILGCADSRVPPEVVFDQGFGDLFTVRVAGNVATDELVASLEYATSHLGPRLIVVLGHDRCGAVKATVDGGTPEGHLDTLVRRIQPAVDATKNEKGDKVDLALRENVRQVVHQLETSEPILAEKVKSGQIKIVGAVYDLDTSKVEFLK